MNKIRYIIEKHARKVRFLKTVALSKVCPTVEMYLHEIRLLAEFRLDKPSSVGKLAIAEACLHERCLSVEFCAVKEGSAFEFDGRKIDLFVKDDISKGRLVSKSAARENRLL